jgi:hypothetical protein
MSYSKGCRPDHKHRRTQKDARLLLAQAAKSPPSFSLEQFEYKPILDQNNCGSCTGHGTAQLCYIALAAAGKPLLWCPSPKDIYTLTRAAERAVNPGMPALTDSGGMPADIMLAVSQWGIRPMRAPSPQGYNSDVDTDNVNDEPKLDELEEDAKKILIGEYRIDEQAPDAIELMRQAIASGVPIGIAAFVDTAFEEYNPADGPVNLINLQDPAGGGHWFGFSGYRTLASGKTVFRGPNSWTATWGDRGHLEVTEDWVRAAVSDIYPFAVKEVA